MTRTIFLLIIFGLASAGLWWLSAQPGEVALTAGTYRFHTNLGVSFVLFAVASVVFSRLLWVLRLLFQGFWAVTKSDAAKAKTAEVTLVRSKTDLPISKPATTRE